MTAIGQTCLVTSLLARATGTNLEREQTLRYPETRDFGVPQCLLAGER
jgi:hypothetical protein